MKRTLAFCLLLSLPAAALAAPPASSAAQADTDAAIQQQMASLQSRMSDLASQMAALSARMGDEARASALHYLADSRRGMLGMAVSRGAHGLRVDAVTPGGPAEQAGLEAGDTITAVDGKSVAGSGRGSETPLWHTQVGQPIALTIDHAGKSREVRVTPERPQAGDLQASIRAAELAANQAVASVRSPEFQQHIQQSIDEAMRSVAARRHGAWIIHAPWFGLNLAPLNPGLGSYFGTDRGVLVLSRDDKQFPDLEPGDVITAAGGKATTQPVDVLRAFRGSAGDQRVQVALRRHGKPRTLTMQVPSQWNVLPPPPPAPPAPPVPAAPAAPPPPPAPPPPTSAH
ncbi:MAG TPA: PDZ domain-containing protein [Rhodanobacteraceae bacterium]|nr:PDZ domain-containing protein [Rhodanobacteraceae bacterium]